MESCRLIRNWTRSGRVRGLAGVLLRRADWRLEQKNVNIAGINIVRVGKRP